MNEIKFVVIRILNEYWNNFFYFKTGENSLVFQRNNRVMSQQKTVKKMNFAVCSLWDKIYCCMYTCTCRVFLSQKKETTKIHSFCTNIRTRVVQKTCMFFYKFANIRKTGFYAISFCCVVGHCESSETMRTPSIFESH